MTMAMFYDVNDDDDCDKYLLGPPTLWLDLVRFSSGRSAQEGATGRMQAQGNTHD